MPDSFTLQEQTLISPAIKFKKCIEFPLFHLLGWWFVCDNEDNQGWAPATYLEPVAAANEEGNDEWVIMGESDSHGMTPYRYVFI